MFLVPVVFYLNITRQYTFEQNIAGIAEFEAGRLAQSGSIVSRRLYLKISFVRALLAFGRISRERSAFQLLAGVCVCALDSGA